MSTLLATTLNPGTLITQNIRITRNINVAAIRPYIYKQGTLVDGQLQLRVLKGATVLETKTIGFAELNAAITSGFAHGYVKFEFNSLPLQVDPDNAYEEYTLELSMINNTPTSSIYVAACKDWDDSKYATYGVSDNSFDKPYGFEIFEYRS